MENEDEGESGGVISVVITRSWRSSAKAMRYVEFEYGVLHEVPGLLDLHICTVEGQGFPVVTSM